MSTLDDFFQSGTGEIFVLGVLLLCILTANSKAGRKNRKRWDNIHKRTYQNYLGDFRWKKVGRRRK